MRQGTYKFIEQTLYDYPSVEDYIRKRVEELTYPVVQEDENIGGGRSGTISKPTERLALTISDDTLISNLRYTKSKVDKVLNEMDPGARKVIELYYFKQPRKYTWVGVAEETKYSEKQCRNIRNMVFERVAKELGMPV